MSDQQPLRAGTRVRLHGNPTGLLLTSFTGTVVCPDIVWDDYYIILLDEPAYEDPPDPMHPSLALTQIRESADNVQVVGLKGRKC